MNAESVSGEVIERSRKNRTMILGRLSSVGQVTVARALKISETTVSNFKSDGRIEQLALMLAVLDLKVVPVAMRCYDPEYISAIFTLAKIKMQGSENAEQLTFED